ncbi:DUF4142 domain-containing protein [uncultured Pontibacter sp.]|uniref:DUF4142 domain-containing protein n=1 Tax=uncultured Pontibacter sp. TaxID=453356 RepID=UPI00261174F9|nr:DUF4142 domain-containing protein [uncultured Pontibacter sp.]
MKKVASTGLFLAAFLFGIVSCNQEQGAVEEAQQTNEQMAEGTEMEDQMTEQSDFMTRAASSGMLEVEAGKLAQQKAQNAEVKKYGEMMVTEHTAANKELMALAQQKNVVVPDSMSQNHMDQMQSLRDKTGADFDKEYMDLMVTSHEEAVTLFEDASNNIQDTEVKNFASTTLPKLRQHHERAQQLKDVIDKQ